MIISSIQWTTEDIECLLKDNGYEGTEKEIKEFLQNFDVRYLEERCVQLGWEMMQGIVEANQK